MKQAYSKKYITPAILLLVALIGRVFYQLAVGQVPFAWTARYLLSYGMAFLLIALYCLIFHHRGVWGKTVYFVAVGWLLAAELVYTLLPLFNTEFSLYHVASILFFLALGAMIAVKGKPHFAFFIAGAVLLMFSYFCQIEPVFLMMKRPTVTDALHYFAMCIPLGLQGIALTLILAFEAFRRKRKEA